MSYKVYCNQDSPRLFKILVTAKYAGVNIDVPPFKLGEDNKTAEFLKKNPVGKVPVLETPEGPIFESNAIARYVARLSKDHKLYGSNDYDAGLVDQWVDFTVTEIDLPSAAWLYPIFGYMPLNKGATDKAKSDIRNVLDVLNNYLLNRTFLVGQRVTLADIVVATSLLRLYQHVLDPNFRKSFTNTTRWFNTVVNQPQFKAVVGEVKLAEKMAVAKAPEKKEEPKAEKPKEQPKKEAPKPKPKEVEEDDDGEEKEEKKAPNPLDALPPTPLIMDEWKRKYSNTDTRGEALPFFWEKWNAGAKDGYSIWFCHYKYNEENEKLFMTLNLLGGFVQRLDKLRKYGFGSLLIFGEEPKLEISGCWLFRGADIPAEMKECDDFPNYDWVKADTNDAATVKLIEDYFAWNGELGGRGKDFHDQGKVFK
jgi:elongation factor 1-gamma